MASSLRFFALWSVFWAWNSLPSQGQITPAHPFPEQSEIYQSLVTDHGLDSALQYLLDYSLAVQRNSVDSCILAYEWTLREADKHEKQEVAQICLSALRFLYRISGQFEKGLQAAQRENKEFEYEKKTVNPLSIYLGLLYLDWGKYDSAQVYLKQYYLDNKLEENKRESGIAANNIGLLYSKIGEFEFAIKYYSDALELAEELQDTQATIYALHNLGGMFLRMDNHVEAEKYLKRAELWCIQADVESILYRTKILLAEVYKRRQNYEEAIRVCHEGLWYLKPLRIYPRIVECYRLFAECYLAMGQLDSTRMYLNKAKLILQDVDQVDLRVKVNLSLARLYEKLGRNQQAISLMEATRIEAEEHHRDGLLPDIYDWLAAFYHAANRWQESSAMSIKANQQRKAWESKKQSHLIYEMQTALDLVQKNQEIAVLHAIQSEQTKQVSLQRKLNIALVVILIAVLCLLGFTWSSLRKSKIIAEQHEHLHEQEIRMKDQERNLSVVQALVNGQETERKRIAIELHDGLGTLLAGIRLRLQSIIPSAAGETDVAEITQIERSMSDAYEEVRRISHDMMPGVLSRYGLVEALENLSSKTQDLTSAEVEFQVIGDPIELSETCNIMIYRIFQELLNNTLKHSEASKIFLQLSFEPTSMTVMVEDNGKGFDRNEVSGRASVGLQSLESRVKFLSGTLEIDSRPDQGTSIVIHFPINFSDLEVLKASKNH